MNKHDLAYKQVKEIIKHSNSRDEAFCDLLDYVGEYDNHTYYFIAQCLLDYDQIKNKLDKQE